MNSATRTPTVAVPVLPPRPPAGDRPTGHRTGRHRPARHRPARHRPARHRPARHRPAWQWPLLGLAAAAALYLVGRGIAEPFVIHWHDPSSYALDWGGPSLAGVLAVHSGPALLIIGAAAWRLRRWVASRAAC